MLGHFFHICNYFEKGYFISHMYSYFIRVSSMLISTGIKCLLFSSTLKTDHIIIEKVYGT